MTAVSALAAFRSASAFLSCPPRTSTHTNTPTAASSQSHSRHHGHHVDLSATAAALHDATLSPGIAAIDAALPTLSPLFRRLRSLPYFSLYSVDMLASCEYLPQELFECYTESCEIYPVDDHEVPPSIKADDFNEHAFELDGWARWDMPSEDYYSTTQFPEDYTGYDGSDVWNFIHDRIGFHDDDALLKDEYDADDWKADFNKAVSGLHSMVSAQIIQGMHDKLNNGDGGDSNLSEYRWTDPVVEFERRLGPHGETPEAVENLYFTMMLLLSGVKAARSRLLRDCDSGKLCPVDDEDEEGETTNDILKAILNHPLLDDPAIDAASRRLKHHASANNNNNNNNSLWEARMRTRDLMRIMNCVQCNKCRFHGKISTMGLSTALQLALGNADAGSGGGDDDGVNVEKVRRVELAALITCLGKFSSGIELCLEMQ